MTSNGGKLEPTIWLIGSNNKHMPALSPYLWVSNEEIALKYLVYFAVWGITAVGYHRYYQGEQRSILVGFAVGLVLLLVNDYLDLYAADILVSKTDGFYYILNDRASTRVVFSDDYFRFSDKSAILISVEEFKRLTKDKKIKTMSLQKYYKEQYVKSFGGTSVENPLGGLDITTLLLNGGSYLFSTLITLSMVAARTEILLFKKIFPFVMLSGLFSIAVIETWFVQYNYISVLKTIQLKTRALITAIAFGVTACLILLLDKY